ncbi:hypothetical protein K438DRAFT_1984028 [Mycena galopus ATCC 62051]|nr:hypothetical protein K438DRAFT_1984028 [Mycena galopus ATCC 62051]
MPSSLCAFIFISFLAPADFSLASSPHRHRIFALVLPTRAPVMESLHRDVAEDPSFPCVSTDFDSNDLTNVPPSRETSLPSQSLVSTNSYPPKHDHTSTHFPPSPETSLPSQSQVSNNSYAPGTHDHLSRLNHSPPPRMANFKAPLFHRAGMLLISAPRRGLLWLREILQHQPQFFFSPLTELSDCSGAPETPYVDTNLPSSAPSVRFEAEHAVRSVTTESDTGPTQSSNGAFGSGTSLHYSAGLADTAEAAPPTIPLQSFPGSSASHPAIAYPELGDHSEPVYNLPNADMCLPPSEDCGPGHERQLFTTDYRTDPSPSTIYGAPVLSARSDPYRRKGPGQYPAVSAGTAPFSSVPPSSSIAHPTTTRSQLGSRGAAPDASYAEMNLPSSGLCERGHVVQSVATVFDSCLSPSTPPDAFGFPPNPPAKPGDHPAVSAGAAQMAPGGPRPSARRHQSTNPLKSGRDCFRCHTSETTQWRCCKGSWFCNPCGQWQNKEHKKQDKERTAHPAAHP